MGKKIILFGGSFDPFHLGHLRVAEDAAQKLGADKVVFIPARRSPHKKDAPAASGRERFEMIEAAIAGRDDFEVSDCELKRPDPSYSLDTVRHFRDLYGPDAELFWLIGADAVKKLHKWYRAGDFIDGCKVCIMNRGGVGMPDFGPLSEALGPERVAKLKNCMISTPRIEISSTDIRRRTASGQNLAGLVPAAVEKYIREHGLYK